MLRSSKICQLANSWSQLRVIEMMKLKRQTHLNYKLRLKKPRLHLLTRTMIWQPYIAWAFVYNIPPIAAWRFVLSRNSSIKLRRAARTPGAKQMLMSVHGISARMEIINGISMAARPPTKKNTHLLSNFWTQMISPLVKLMPIPATKTFVVTINYPRLTPAKLSLRPKQLKIKRESLNLKALVTG